MDGQKMFSLFFGEKYCEKKLAGHWHARVVDRV